MNQLFLLAILLAMLLPPNQNLPEAFYKIPEPLRESATLILSGTFAQGRTPCMIRPDGTRVWAIDSSFQIKRVYRGEVVSKSIRVNAASLPKTTYVSQQLKREQEYLVLLRPGKEAIEKMKTKEGLSFWDALEDQEIIAIVEFR